MSWWQTLIVALSTYVVTKAIDLLISWISEKREFKKYQREMVYTEVEDLKNQIGVLYELSANGSPLMRNKNLTYQDSTMITN